MKKLLIVLGLIAVLIGATYGGVALADKPTGDGCKSVFWKKHSECWECFSQDDLVGWVFLVPPELHELADDTLMDALKYKGGSGYEGAARLLLKQAVAAVLNACHSDVDYPMSVGEVISNVDNALRTLDRGEMRGLRHILKRNNNLGRPIDGMCG